MIAIKCNYSQRLGRTCNEYPNKNILNEKEGKIDHKLKKTLVNERNN